MGGGAAIGPWIGEEGRLNGWIAFAPGDPAPGGATGNGEIGIGAPATGIQNKPVRTGLINF